MKTSYLVGISIFFLFALVYSLYTYAVSSPFVISAAKAKELIQNNKFDVVLDVRTDLERNTLGYFPKSVHIQSADLEKEMPLRYPNKNIRILAYCNTGQRSRKATEILHSLGYTNSVYIVSPYTSLL